MMEDAELENMIADVRHALDGGLLPSRIFNDATIHQGELERVFGRTWVFLGHESEVAAAGDYVLRYIGEDPFVLVRDEHGQVRAFFDACRHRGTQLCRAEKGNASHFRCPYHGWTYKNTGELIGAPAYRDAYGEMDRAAWGLLPVARLASVHGLVFATLDPAAPSLDEYLGGMRWYLDVIFGLSPQGMEVVGEPQRWVVDANWKTGAENFCGDDYHTLYLHRSMWDIGTIQIPAAANMLGYHVQAAPGHSVSFSMAPDPDDPGPKFWGYAPEVVDLFDPGCVDETQFDFARRSRISVGTVFPNLSFLVYPGTADPATEEPTGLATVRQWQPRGPGRLEVWSWVLAWRGTPEQVRKRAYRAAIGTFGSAGLFEQDDTEPWQSISRTAGSVFARRQGLALNYTMGSNPSSGAQLVEQWVGPGLAYAPRYEEGVHRNFYRRWCDFMISGAYPGEGQLVHLGPGAGR